MGIGSLLRLNLVTGQGAFTQFGKSRLGPSCQLLILAARHALQFGLVVFVIIRRHKDHIRRLVILGDSVAFFQQAPRIFFGLELLFALDTGVIIADNIRIGIVERRKRFQIFMRQFFPIFALLVVQVIHTVVGHACFLDDRIAILFSHCKGFKDKSVYARALVEGTIFVMGDVVYGSAGSDLVGIQRYTVSKGQIAAKGRHETPE